MKLLSSPKRITYLIWLVCVTLALIVSTLTGCIVVSEAQYYDPLYQNPTIVYDVWPQSNYFYNYSNTTYIYPKPKNKKPRHNHNYPNKPRKHRKSLQNNVRGPR